MSVKIKLNSAGIKKVLMDEPALRQAINDAASEVEKQLQPAIDENNELASSSGRKMKSGGQTTFMKEGEPKDRMATWVGIDDAKASDFVFGSIAKAVSRAGGAQK